MIRIEMPKWLFEQIERAWGTQGFFNIRDKDGSTLYIDLEYAVYGMLCEQHERIFHHGAKKRTVYRTFLYNLEQENQRKERVSGKTSEINKQKRIHYLTTPIF